MRRKKFQKVKERDGQVSKINENELLFEKINEDPMLFAIDYAALTQSSVHNIAILNKKLTEA